MRNAMRKRFPEEQPSKAEQPVRTKDPNRQLFARCTPVGSIEQKTVESCYASALALGEIFSQPVADSLPRIVCFLSQDWKTLESNRCIFDEG